MLGAQQPRFWHAPEHAESDIDDIDEFCEVANIPLDDAQRFVLRHSMGTSDGQWVAGQVGVCAPRQNGKSQLLEARELYGAFVLGEGLIVHSAQLFPTALEQFRRVQNRIESTPALRKKVKRISTTNGKEAVELLNGSRIEFKSRSGMSGRGLSADCIVLDEAMFLPEEVMGAMVPTMSARPNPQLWLAGSAVDQTRMMDGVVFARLREQGLAKAERLAWFEWSVDCENPELLSPEDLENPELWAQANAAYGRRIGRDNILMDLQAMSSRTFATERLGIGDWPRTDGLADLPIPLEDWDACLDRKSEVLNPVWFAFDVTPTSKRATISAAGFSVNGGIHVETVKRFQYTGEMLAFLAELVAKHQPLGVVCDGASPAAASVPELRDLGVEVVTLTAGDHAKACEALSQGVTERTIRHRDDRPLRDAIRGAARRPLIDGWAFSRKNSNLDISPLVAAALASWRVLSAEPSPEPFMEWLTI